jgi:hypothetical protein
MYIMENTDDLDEKLVGGSGGSFVEHMTNLSSLEKNELLNMSQYILLAIIPLALFLKGMKMYVPEGDDEKNSIEIVIEVVIQSIAIFVVFFFIHKWVVFFPTYSKAPYSNLNLIQIILVVLFLMLCMKNAFSEKVSILLDRALSALGLKEEPKPKPKREEKPATNYVASHQRPPLQAPPPPAPSQPPENYGQPSHGQQSYGLSEPVASNEIGAYNAY